MTMEISETAKAKLRELLKYHIIIPRDEKGKEQRRLKK